MANDMDAKNAWVGQVLGIAVTTSATAAPAAPEANTAPDETMVATISPVKLGKCRLIWVQTVGKVHAQAQTLKQTVMSACRDSGEYESDELAQVEAALQEIDDMVSEIDEELADLVDDVINAEAGPGRIAAQRAAMAKADELTKFVTGDADFALIDQNEYMPTNIRTMTLAGLGAIRKELTGVG
jgi:hypothetical protein